jgi:hypothetical protein
MSRVGEAFRITIPLRRLFKNPTVAGLAEALVEGWQDASLVEQIALLHLGAANDDALSLAATAPPD